MEETEFEYLQKEMSALQNYYDACTVELDRYIFIYSLIFIIINLLFLTNTITIDHYYQPFGYSSLFGFILTIAFMFASYYTGIAHSRMLANIYNDMINNDDYDEGIIDNIVIPSRIKLRKVIIMLNNIVYIFTMISSIFFLLSLSRG